jgi:hypothetical protein
MYEKVGKEWTQMQEEHLSEDTEECRKSYLKMTYPVENIKGL